jgi:hypothetical protein
MRSYFFIFLCLIFVQLSIAQVNSKHTYVNGYYRSNGTYVKGHYKTVKNNTNRDNFSTKGNNNPYTGQAGWVDPDINYSNGGSSYSSNNYNKPRYNYVKDEFGQNVINYSDGKEVFNLCESCYNIKYDKEIDYHWYTADEGINSSKGNSKGILLDGSYKMYDVNNFLIESSNYVKGIRHGDFIIWDKEKSFYTITKFNNGEIIYLKYKNDENLIIEYIGNPEELGGECNKYNSNGRLKSNAKVIGPDKVRFKYYFEENGKLFESYTNFKGIKDGEYITYHKNGNIYVKGLLKMGLMDGVWIFYKDNNELDFEIKFRIVEEYYNNGNLKVRGS